MPSRQTGTHGNRFLRALAREGIRIFSTAEAKEIAEHADVPVGYVTNLLMLLERDGWIKRLRRGLYARSVEASGETQIHPFTIVTNVVVPSAISHWSALHHHGLTEQIPRTITAFTPKKVVTPSMRRSGKTSQSGKRHWKIEGIRCEFTTVKEKYFFGIERVWVDEYSRIPITDKERTTLETFASARKFGGIGEALSIIDLYLHSIDLAKFIEYACRYDVTAVAKRVGWALEKTGVKPDLLEPLRKIKATGYNALDPTLPSKGSCNRRWMILNNLSSRKLY